MGREWATGIPEPKNLSGMGLAPSPSNTDGQYRTGMGLAPSPPRSVLSALPIGRNSDMPANRDVAHRMSLLFWAGSLVVLASSRISTCSRGLRNVQVLIRWALQNGTSVIPKASSEAHLRSNLEVLNWELSPEDFKELSSIEYQVHVLLVSRVCMLRRSNKLWCAGRANMIASSSYGGPRALLRPGPPPFSYLS
jgi:Aldo/keto reductase family